MLSFFRPNLIIVLFCICCNIIAFPQEANTINAICQKEERILKIDAKGSGATMIDRKAIKILNQKGQSYGDISYYYGYNKKIKKITGRITDKNGRIVKKLKPSEIDDYNAQSSISLYVDTRVKTFKLMHSSFPYTIEYEVTIDYTHAFYYPEWSPSFDEDLLNQYSKYEIQVPEGKQLLFKSERIEKPFVEQASGITNYRWEITNLQPLKEESFSYDYVYQTPRVLAAPRDFNTVYSGSNDTWKDFGNWIYSLNEGRSELTEKVKSEIDSIKNGLRTDWEIVDRLYEYLKTTTRYVGIQEGIGGWQPLSAEYVCQNKFGDCKALTNYMQSMLEYCGVKSYYTLINAGYNKPDILVDFPSNQFNHAILFIPLDNDSLWLDCTSKVSPTGFIELSIADRHALIIKKDASILAKTPTYDQARNNINYSGKIVLSDDLSGTGQVLIKKSGFNSTQSRILEKYYHKRVQERYRKPEMNFPSYSFKLIKHTESVENKTPITEDSARIDIDVVGRKVGNSIIIKYPISNEYSLEDLDTKQRKSDIYIPYSYSRTDSIFLKVPNGYKNVKEQAQEYTSQFGSMSTQIREANEMNLLISNYTLHAGKYGAEVYPDFKEFLKKLININSYEITILPMD